MFSKKKEEEKKHTQTQTKIHRLFKIQFPQLDYFFYEVDFR